MDEFGPLIGIVAIVMGIVWLCFPFVVMSALRDIREDQVKVRRAVLEIEKNIAALVKHSIEPQPETAPPTLPKSQSDKPPEQPAVYRI